MDPAIFNSVFPVKTVDVYKQGMIVNRTCLLQDRQGRSGKRGEITELSKRSLSRLAFVARNTSVVFRSMITLTYPQNYPKDGLQSKQQLRELLNYLTYHNAQFECLWFLEFQSKTRQAPHYHLLTNVLTPNKYMRRGMARTWAQIVSRETKEQGKVYRVHSHPRAWEGIKTPDGAIHYCIKYALKPQQKRVPLDFQNVGRFWGHTEGVKPIPLVVDVEMTTEDLDDYIAARSTRLSGMSIKPKYILFP